MGERLQPNPKVDRDIVQFAWCVPTVADRVAQTAVKIWLEPRLDPIFRDDSYGYRPGKSALAAIAVTRRRCWDYDWVVEFDIRGLFDNLDHGLLMKALRKHCQEPWILLYVERWLKAPMQTMDGQILARDKGTPQGGRRSWPICFCTMRLIFG